MTTSQRYTKLQNKTVSKEGRKRILMTNTMSRYDENAFCNGGLCCCFDRGKQGGKIFSIFLQFLGVLGKYYA